jgi:signal transduction histidine kinase/ligand-binding sensor domain-containing protein
MKRLALVLLLAWCPAVPALDSTLDMAQYAHAAWRIREGFAKSNPASMAQTPDGYLWLGTEFGLLRFDGVRAVPWQPPAGATLPHRHIRSLLAGRDGTLWIGTPEGLASWREGRLTQYPQLAGHLINAFAEDREGTVWLSTFQPPRTPWLCAVRAALVSCEADSKVFGEWIASLHVDSQDGLWVVGGTGLWQWRPGPRKFYALPERAVVGTLQGLAEGEQGNMLIVTRRDLMEITDGALTITAHRTPLPTPPARLLRDRHGGIWVGTTDQGLLHIHAGRVDGFTRADGLSGDNVQRLFEDREGNIWVATMEGLDRFSEVAATTYSSRQGLSSAYVGSVLATRDGSVLLGTRIGLARWDDSAMHDVAISGLPDRPVSLFEDSRGRIWFGSEAGLGYIERGRVTAIDGPPGTSGISGALIDSFAEDRHGSLWVAHRNDGLIRISGDKRIETFPWPQLGHEDAGMRMAIDPLREGLWIGFALGGIAHFVDGRVDMSLSVADGLGKGRVYSLRADPDGTVWAGTDGGLSRLKNGRIVTLTSADGLPCDAVDWILDYGDDVWVYTACGLARMTRAELDAALLARERGTPRPLRLTVFDNSDGVRSSIGVGSYSPHVARGPDGRLWFATLEGVGVLNPQRIPRNEVAPPVHIEQVIADRKLYDAWLASGAIALPALTRDLQIDYTALSFTAPEKMRFRYRLLGYDSAWQDVGTRRQAFYTDLPPNDYRFQVIASNNDGVWNETGASVALSIAPTFYQTRWFAGLCIAAVAGIVWLLLSVRGKQIEMRMRVRLEERVLERERLARDLHDTFLQSMQGLVLRFHAVMTRLPEDSAARRMMEQALTRADEVISEGRARVYDLRQSAQVTDDLPQALTAIGEERAQTSDTKFRVVIQGTPRSLHPVVREEAYRIGVEALANAFRHSVAANIDVHIHYGRNGLSLRVVDDGRGYDVAVLKDAVVRGHFGLAGLRERAHRIRAQLEVSSRPGAGSAVELRVPAAIAYATGRSTNAPVAEELPWT